MNINDKKKNEIMPQMCDLRYKILYESSSDALMTLEAPLWKFTSGNPAAIKMFSAKNEAEFTSAEPWKLSPEKQPDGSLSAEKAKEKIDIAMREESVFFEWTHKRLNGEDFPATVLLTKVVEGENEFLQATVRDITIQKKIEESLKESEIKYRTLTETSTDCIKLFDIQGNLIFINNGGKKEHFLKTEEDIKNFKPIDAVIEDDKPKFMASFEAAKMGKGSIIELRHTKEGSNRDICSEMFQPIINSDGKVVSIFAVSRDLTETKQIEIVLNNKISELEQMNKLMVGRELKMIELKKEIEVLETKLQGK